MNIQEMNEALMEYSKERILSGNLNDDQREQEFKNYVMVANVAIEQQKVDAANDEIEIRKEDNEIKKAQLKDQKLDRYVRVGSDMIKLGLPLAIYVGLNGLWMNFEKTDLISSKTVMNGVNALSRVLKIG